MIFFPECSTFSEFVIIGRETPNVSKDLHTVVKNGEEYALSDCVQLVSGQGMMYDNLRMIPALWGTSVGSSRGDRIHKVCPKLGQASGRRNVSRILVSLGTGWGGSI